MSVFLKVSCIYRVLYLTFFGAIWHFLRVDLAFFTYDYLATLLTTANLRFLSKLLSKLLVYSAGAWPKVF